MLAAVVRVPLAAARTILMLLTDSTNDNIASGNTEVFLASVMYS